MLACGCPMSSHRSWQQRTTVNAQPKLELRASTAGGGSEGGWVTRRTPPYVRIFARGASSGLGQGVLRFTRRFIEVRPDQLNIPEAGGTPALYTEIVI